MRVKKAQITIEFVIILAMLLAVFLILFTIINARTDEFYFNQRSLDAKGIADKVAYNINQVYLSGVGSSLNFRISDTLMDNTTYLLTIYSDSKIVEILYSGRQYVSPILTTLNQSDFTTTGGYLVISNKEGGIIIE